MSDLTWSILVLTIPNRVKTGLPRLIERLNSQIGEDDPVEVLYLGDNERIPVGRKWNILLEASRGEYISCIGDDDLVSPDYVPLVLKAIEENPGVDCVTFDELMFHAGKFVATVHWGTEYSYRDDWEGRQLWRFPGEKMVVRRDIRMNHLYDPDRWRGSDWRMCKTMQEDIKTEFHIDEVLYHYFAGGPNQEHVRNQTKADARRRAKRDEQAELAKTLTLDQMRKGLK